MTLTSADSKQLLKATEYDETFPPSLPLILSLSLEFSANYLPHGKDKLGVQRKSN